MDLIELYQTSQQYQIDAFDTLQFGPLTRIVQHDSVILTHLMQHNSVLLTHSVHINSVSLTHLTQSLALFLEHLEGEFGNFKHIPIFREIKFSIYEFSCHHCWIPLTYLNLPFQRLSGIFEPASEKLSMKHKAILPSPIPLPPIYVYHRNSRR